MNASLGNTILLACFLSNVAGSLRVKHLMKAYLSEPYNGIQITFDSPLQGRSAASFPFSQIYSCVMASSCLRDPGIQGPPGIQGSTALGKKCCFLEMLWILVSQITLLVECPFPRKHFNNFLSKLGQIKLSNRQDFSENAKSEP